MRTLFRRLLLLATLLFALPRAVDAQKGPGDEEITQLALISDTAAVEPGKPFYLGFHFRIIDRWHLYWRFAGSAGYPLTITEWRLPPGFKAEPLGFPLPYQVNDALGQTFFAYEHEVLFPVKITPPQKLSAGEIKIGSKVKWQVCEQTCIPGNADLEIALPVGSAKPANEPLFQKWLAELPQTSAPPTEDVKFEFVNKKLAVRIGGLPADAAVEFFPIPPPKFSGLFEFGQKATMETQSDGTRIARYPFDSEMDWSGLLVLKDKDGKRKGWYIGDPPKITIEKPATVGDDASVADDGDTWDPFDDIEVGEKGKAQQNG
jgi:DsbC/DsbD-like thiol-disulfide interchange protein